jgi:hypothetical protein
MNPVGALGDLLPQFVPHVPLLIAYVAGLVVAVVYGKRYPRPCLLLGLACFLLLMTAIVTTVGFYVVMRSQAGGRFLGHVLTALNLVGGLLRAAGFALVVLAVFVDRGRRSPSDERSRDDMATPRVGRPAPPADSTGIQEGRP